jgi:hypothetical protein
LNDLADDLEKVLGSRPVVQSGAVDTSAEITLGIDPTLPGAEAYRIQTTQRQVRIDGSDQLGAIYGIYRFSEQFLGVDPFWFWKDQQPARRDSIALKPQIIQSPATAFGYRGWFINDEDLLSEWKPGSGRRTINYPYYQQVINLKVADRIFETLLRAHGNLIVPSSFIDVMNPPEAALVSRAVERGLYVTQHHIEPLGVSHFAFEHYWKQRGERDVAFSYGNNPEKVRTTWRAYAEKWRQLCGDQVVWQLGLRGKGDVPIWQSDKSVTRVQAGDVISRAVTDQWKIIRAIDPRPQPPATMTLWLEGSELMSRNQLKLPPGIMLVFADEGATQTLQPDFYQTPRAAEYKYGVYYHIAFFAHGPHLVQGVPPQKVQRVFNEVLAKKDTAYAIINVANIREHVFGIQAAMEIMSQGQSWQLEYFLSHFAPPVLQNSYRDFYAAFAQPASGKLLQDGDVWSLAKPLLAAMARRDAADYSRPETVVTLQKSIEQLDNVIATYPADQLTTSQRRFYDVHLLTQARVLRGLYSYLMQLYLATQDRSHLVQATAALEEVLRVRQRAEESSWANWYRGDKKENWAVMLQRTRVLLSLRRREVLLNS